jgi:hypothetical protein
MQRGKISKFSTTRSPLEQKLLDLILFCLHGLFACFPLIKACPLCTRFDSALSVRKAMPQFFCVQHVFMYYMIHVLYRLWPRHTHLVWSILCSNWIMYT